MDRHIHSPEKWVVTERYWIELSSSLFLCSSLICHTFIPQFFTKTTNQKINFLFSFFIVIHKGQVLTHYYRLMNKSGGYTWLQTCATVVCNSKNAEEQNIICVNYVIR